jgi:RNA polymerase sigma-70 factor (ECF subfamily)
LDQANSVGRHCNNTSVLGPKYRRGLPCLSQPKSSADKGFFSRRRALAIAAVVRKGDLRRAFTTRIHKHKVISATPRQAGKGLHREAFMQTAYRLPDFSRTYPDAPSPEASDETLILSIARRDKRAMQVLFARHNVKVYRFISRLIGNASPAEDIVSEVFLNVWRRADSFETRSRVSTWLLAIARNKALAALRRGPPTQLDDDIWRPAIVDLADDPETTVNRKNRSAIIRKCLEQFSPAHQEIIDLVYYHEKSVKEIAQIVGIPEGTVKTRLFHAGRRVADLLKKAGVPGLWAC